MYGLFIIWRFQSLNLIVSKINNFEGMSQGMKLFMLFHNLLILGKNSVCKINTYLFTELTY
jgi:hypothetical protein